MNRMVKLGKVCEFVYGESLKEERRHPGRVPVFGSNGVVGWHDEAITDGPTIIIGRKGSIGEVNWSNEACFPIDTTYYIQKTKQPCHLRWLYFMLLKLDLTRLNKSAAVPGLNRDDAYRQLIPFPEFSEQQRIARHLEKADRLRRMRRYTLELSEAFLQSVFLDMFGDYFETDQPKTRFSNLVRITGGGTPSREVPAYFTGHIPWLTSKDMHGDYIWDTQEHVTNEAIANSAAKLVPAGSILVVVKSKVLLHRLPLAISKVSLCHGQDIKSIQCSNKVLPEFTRYVLKYYEPNLLQIARGANTEGLTLPMLEGLLVPAVGLSLQQKFSDIVKRFERMRVQQREAERQAQHLFQSLLHRSFAEDL